MLYGAGSTDAVSTSRRTPQTTKNFSVPRRDIKSGGGGGEKFPKCPSHHNIIRNARTQENRFSMTTRPKSAPSRLEKTVDKYLVLKHHFREVFPLQNNQSISIEECLKRRFRDPVAFGRKSSRNGICYSFHRIQFHVSIDAKDLNIMNFTLTD